MRNAVGPVVVLGRFGKVEKIRKNVSLGLNLCLVHQHTQGTLVQVIDMRFLCWFRLLWVNGREVFNYKFRW